MKNRLFRRLAVPSGLLLPLFVLLTGAAPSQTSAKTGAATESFYDLTLPSLEGDPVDMSVYRGKVTLVAERGLEEALRRAEELAGEAVAALSGFGPEADALREIVRIVSARRG